MSNDVIERWVTVEAEAALYVDRGCDAILCDRLQRPATLVLKNPVLRDGAFLPSAVSAGLRPSLADRRGASALLSDQPGGEGR